MTTQQVRDQTKDVTRRVGWWCLKTGDVLNACVKCMGIKKGEKIEVICQIRVKGARPEPLNVITQEEVIREGFPNMTPQQFIAFFIKGHPRDRHKKPMTPESEVNRIEFEYL